MKPVLARKYRPQTFDDVIGQEAIVSTLRNALASGRVAHGFIFSGHRGIGKTTVARILAKAMNCRRAPGPTPTPCGECEACREIAESNSVDVLEIDAASNRGIDEIRQLRDNARYRPARDRTKFFILDEAHQLTDDAFNALLKTLEEPPEWVMFVLATTEPEQLPPTIRSRCQHFAFRALSFGTTLERLRQICAAEAIEAEPQALELAAEAGEGSLRDALSLLDQVIAHDGERLRAETVRQLLGRVSGRRLLDLMAAVRDADSARALSELDDLLQSGVTPAQLARQSLQWLRAMLIARTAGADSPLLAMPGPERLLVAEAAAWFGEEQLTRFLQIMLRAAGDLRHAPAERLHLELGIVKLIHASHLTSLEEVIRALDPGARVAAPAPAQKKNLISPESLPVPTAPAPPASAPTAPAPPASAPTPILPAGSSADVISFAEPSSAAAGAEPPASPPASDPIAAPPSPVERLRQYLAQNRVALAEMLDQAEVIWDGRALLLRFDGENDGFATIFAGQNMQSELRQAIRQALGYVPEIRIERAAPAPSIREANAARLREAEARAARHPALQRLRELLPGDVLETRPLDGHGNGS